MDTTPTTPTTPTQTSEHVVVRVGFGKESHLATVVGRPFAFCKGLRAHRARKLSDNLATITCSKCRNRAVALGLIAA